MKIGIGISTTPERNIFSVDRWKNLVPNGMTFVLCDRNHDGVAATKNKLLKLLDDCEHIFLFDDDTYPIAEDWWKPYIDSSEPHLMYQFDLPNKPKMTLLHADGEITAWNKTRGAMLYIHRSVLDVVGGMDENYKNGFEHPDWTNRIHNAGLTTYRAMDVAGSNKLLYCLDQDGGVESSIKKDPVQHRKNYEYYRKNRLSKEYKEYKS